jgi:glycosyltransferase involved in cell wall biosynthesis
MPVVSVIVPAYNSAAFIGEAIDSLLRQTLHDIEIIVIDDGSDDATHSIAASRAQTDTRVKVIRREQGGGGPARARNAGLVVARGEYVALLDADDVALPNRLASMVAAMRTAHAEIGFADMVRLDMRTGAQESTGILAQREFLQDARSYLASSESGTFSCHPEFLGFMLAHHWVVSVPTIVWSRALLEQESAWFDEALICAEDIDLFMRLAARGKMVFINEVVAVVRKHPQSLTSTAPVTTIVDGAKVRERHLSALRDRLRPSDVAATRKFIAHAWWEVGYALWLAGETSAARSQFLHSFRLRRSRAAAIGYLKALFPRRVLTALLRRGIASDASAA